MFCATCNNARNTRFWNLEPRKCPNDPICLKDSYYDLGKIISLKDMCFYYILNAALKREWPKKRLNFHCDLCNGQNDVGCFSLASYVPPPPSFGVLFRFGWSGFSATLPDGKKVEIVNKCPVFHVYDPFRKSCGRILPLENKNVSRNCTDVFLRVDEFNVFENETIFVKDHNKSYEKEDYQVKKHGVYICSNFSTKYKSVIIKRRPNRIMEMFTYAGCGVSITALLFLLFTYGMFPELRNVPGKNLMNLASAFSIKHSLWLQVEPRLELFVLP